MDKDEIKKGTQIRTTEDAGRDDWVAENRMNIKWGVLGTVLRHSNSHGLCFLVLHTDGTEAWYDADEVEVIEDILEQQESQSTSTKWPENAWNLKIIRADNGYIVVGTWDSDMERAEVITETVDDELPVDDPDKIAMYNLLHEIIDYFGMAGSKYDEYRLSVTFEKRSQ